MGRVAGSVVGALGTLWRHSFGLLLQDSCRFTPSCSHYAAEAVQRRGLLVGLPLAVWRVLRCNPLGKGGFDPVVRSRPPCGRGPVSSPGPSGSG
jgi:putative membrane protein insertion efficiency factor